MDLQRHRSEGVEQTLEVPITAPVTNDAADILRFLAGVGIVAAAVLVPLVALLLLAWLVRRRVVSSQRERALDQ